MIRIENYSFTYAGSENKVLENITTTIEPGSFTLLCGASGCGKTTLLLSLKKSLVPAGEAEGTIWIQDVKREEMDDLAAAAIVGYVGQNPEQMIVTDKVWHELAFGLESLGVPVNQMKKRVAEVAQFFGLQELYALDTATLSGGQKQLVALASVMAMQPEILILDEPTSQLDPLAATEFLHILKRINEELGTTILLCEHRLEEVFFLSDRIILMDQGRIEAEGSKEDLCAYLASKGELGRFYQGLPAPARIFTALNHEDNKTCPISIKEGRLWFQSYCREKKIPEVRDGIEKQVCETKRAFENTKPILLVEELYVTYEERQEAVLKAASLKLHKGEWYCLLGGNGAGKSTFLKVLCGQLAYQQGKILYHGAKIEKKNRISMGYEGMVYLPQNPALLFSQISVKEELEVMLSEPYWPQSRNLSDASKAVMLSDMLNHMELTEVSSHHPYDLSGGQMQRLALAKLFLLKPKILLLDEPTKGMDPGFKSEFAKIVSAFCQSGGSVLMVSHDVEFSAEYVDTCGLLFDGEIVSEGEAKAFFAGNNFYTTSTNKMVRTTLEHAVTVTEVVKRCTTD